MRLEAQAKEQQQTLLLQFQDNDAHLELTKQTNKKLKTRAP